MSPDPEATHVPSLVQSTRTSPTMQDQHQMPMAEAMAPPEGGPLTLRQREESEPTRELRSIATSGEGPRTHATLGHAPGS